MRATLAINGLISAVILILQDQKYHIHKKKIVQVVKKMKVIICKNPFW